MRLKALPGLVFTLFVFVNVAVAALPGDACDLPESLQLEIAAKYPSTKPVTLSALDTDDKKFFQKDQGDACPGVTKVDFYGDGKPTIAVVLIPDSGSMEEAKLVIAHQLGDHWQTTTMDTADGAPVPVVWSRPPGHYTDVLGKKEIRATRPVIVFTGYESWSILYAWTGSGVAKIWLQD